MHTRLRDLSIAAGCVCLFATAAMGVASFLPYVGYWGDALPPQLLYASLAGPSLLFALGTVMTLGACVVLHLAGRRRHLTAFCSLGASIVSVGLALLLPGTYLSEGRTYRESMMVHGVGVNLLFNAAALAVLASLVMIIATLAGEHPVAAQRTTRSWTPLHSSRRH